MFKHIWSKYCGELLVSIRNNPPKVTDCCRQKSLVSLSLLYPQRGNKPMIGSQGTDGVERVPAGTLTWLSLSDLFLYSGTESVCPQICHLFVSVLTHPLSSFWNRVIHFLFIYFFSFSCLLFVYFACGRSYLYTLYVHDRNEPRQNQDSESSSVKTVTGSCQKQRHRLTHTHTASILGGVRLMLSAAPSAEQHPFEKLSRWFFYLRAGCGTAFIP